MTRMPVPLRRIFLAWAIAGGLTPVAVEAQADRARPNDATAQVLARGLKLEGTLKAGEVRSLPVQTQPGDYVLGRFDGRQIRLAIVANDGSLVRVLSPRGGQRQEFMFLADERSPAAFELRAEAEGPYQITIERHVPAGEQRPPAEVFESPRLRRLAAEIEGGESTELFWKEIEANHAPLVERDGVQPPLDEGMVLVTFLCRGAKHAARIFAAPSNDHDPMRRLGSSDVWYGSYRVPSTARIGYKIAPDVPELNDSPVVRRRAILATAQRDPFNPVSYPDGDLPDRFAGESLLELPDAPKQPWLEPRPDVAPGTVEHHAFESAILKNQRDVAIYRPHDYKPGDPENGLIVFFDGDRYLEEVGIARVLDNLNAAGAIRPTAAVLISNATGESRSAELPPNPLFARFLAEELMPWAEAQKVKVGAEHTVIAGASYGGLASAYAGFMHPELFGNVYSQSGSFWWWPSADLFGMKRTGEPEWLTRQYATTEKRPLRFYLEAGTFETTRTSTGILDATRHLRDVLEAKGYPVRYAEFAGGHGFLHWKYTVADGIVGLLGSNPR